MSQQLDLFGDNDAHAADLEAKRRASRPTPTDPNINPDEAFRVNSQSSLILARLREGPATNVELEQVSGSRRMNSRIADVRRWLRKHENKTIESHCTDSRSGIYVYEIVRL